MKAETKYRGSIKLAAIGDALGWITEFEKSPDSILKKYNTETVTKFYSWTKPVGGRFNGYIDNISAGSYSDDTQLLLSVARSINIDGSVDNEYFSKTELPEWLLYSRGAGRTIKNAARKITRKSARWNKNFFSFKAGKKTIDYRESGANGAAMRILPIALANFGDSDKINEEIFANSIITHGHPRAILGAMLYGYAVDTILRFNSETFNYTTFLTNLGKDIHQKFAIHFIDKPEFKSWENEWNRQSSIPFQSLFNDTISETRDYLRETYRFIQNDTSDFDALSKLGCYKNETKGSGISTVIAGIYLACKYAHKPLQSIEAAVNAIGTDTDSIAAFTGGLIGALHGQSIIPSRWKNVQDFDYLDKIALNLLVISEGRSEPDTPKIQSSKLKSLNTISGDDFEENDEVHFNPLGIGKINSIDRQKTLTKGKYNLIIDVSFQIGQSCIFAKLLNLSAEKGKELFPQKQPDSLQTRINLFAKSLSSEAKKEFLAILDLVSKG